MRLSVRTLLIGILMPLVIIGSLLGIVTSADTALERIPVALVNNDELITETDDAGEETFFFASKPLVTELVSGDTSVDWVITDTDNAQALLSTGEVYAVIEIPDDFSQAVKTLDSAEPTQARFTIYTDPSHSYLAGVLADQLGASISSTISDEFGKEVTKGLFSAVVDLGDGISEAADAAEEVADGTRELADGVSELADGTSDLADGTKKFSDGYATFDDGLDTYLRGVRDLADGLETFNKETKSLPDLSTGISQYTGGVSQVATGLSGLNDAGVFSGITGTTGTTLQTLIATLSALGTSGTTLATQTDTAIDGVRDGIVSVDKGADALAEASYDLEEGSNEIRTGAADLASGTSELNDGVSDLNDGVIELADGMDEFASGLRDGATEFSDQGLEEPSDSTLDTLTTPVAFDEQDRTGTVGLGPTIGSALVPVGLWFVTLIYFLSTQAPSRRVLTSTASTAAIIRRTVAPIAVVAGLQIVMATLLLHVLAGVSWTLMGLTLGLIALGTLSFHALHYAIWMWKPQVLGALSMTLAVVQIVTLGLVLPSEVLPPFYQVLSGATPLGWLADGMLASVSSGDGTRVSMAIIGLALVLIVALVIALVGVGARRRRAMLDYLGLAA